VVRAREEFGLRRLLDSLVFDGPLIMADFGIGGGRKGGPLRYCLYFKRLPGFFTKNRAAEWVKAGLASYSYEESGDFSLQLCITDAAIRKIKKFGVNSTCSPALEPETALFAVNLLFKITLMVHMPLHERQRGQYTR
jgi:hypothetical protein